MPKGVRGALARAALGALLLTLAGLAGSPCRAQAPNGPGPLAWSPTLVGAAASEFDYADHLPPPSDPITDADGDYWTRSLTMPSVGENGQDRNLVTAYYYQGKRAGPKPLVIVLPIWGISAYPSSRITAGLRERSAGALSVLQILGDQTLLDYDAIAAARNEAELFAVIDRMVDRFVSTVIDIRRLVDWASTQDDVDPDRIALIGFSMGALVASVTIANEPRLAAGVLVMGGADPHEILAACDHEIEHAREQVLARLDWSRDDFRRALEQPLARINPARFAGMVDPSRVLMIEAGADTCVPKTARDRLWQAMGRPERVTYQYGHRMAFLAMTFLGGNSLQRQIYRFFDERLD